MLHDAHIEVTCDGDKCSSTVNVSMDFCYMDYTGKNGYYDHADDKIESKLVEDHEWIVIEGKHYCCAQCASPTGYA